MTRKTGRGINRERLRIWKRFNRIPTEEEALASIKARRKARREPYLYLHEFSYALRGRFGEWRQSRRKNAVQKGIRFQLSTAELEELYARCREHCPSCGLPWVHLRQHPQAPSIDRIDTKLGYSFTNAQILCRQCNRRKDQANVRYLT